MTKGRPAGTVPEVTPKLLYETWCWVWGAAALAEWSRRVQESGLLRPDGLLDPSCGVRIGPGSPPPGSRQQDRADGVAWQLPTGEVVRWTDGTWTVVEVGPPPPVAPPREVAFVSAFTKHDDDGTKEVENDGQGGNAGDDPGGGEAVGDGDGGAPSGRAGRTARGVPLGSGGSGSTSPPRGGRRTGGVAPPAEQQPVKPAPGRSRPNRAALLSDKP